MVEGHLVSKDQDHAQSSQPFDSSCFVKLPQPTRFSG
jgi:hypothetical protein